MDSSCTLDTAQTGFNMREKGTEVTDFTSLEEGISTQSENQGKDPNRDLLCSPLLGNTSLFLASSKWLSHSIRKHPRLLYILLMESTNYSY